ncbi:diacylglycerol kinase family lipid kinase, partial [Streptomyces sp. NPDC001761]
MRQFTAVVNPTAGGSTGAATLLRLARLLREGGAELETEYSHSLAPPPGHPPAGRGRGR